MAQPEFVPTGGQTTVRPEASMPTPEGWFAQRPAELQPGQPLPSGRGFGSPGPDQGFALGLFRRFKDGVTLHAAEHWNDVVAGCLGVANARASIFGRAPIVHDVRLALYTFGFLGDAPQDLVEWRTALFAEAAHHYQVQRQIVSLVTDATLRLTPEQAGAIVREGRWQSLFSA